MSSSWSSFSSSLSLSPSVSRIDFPIFPFSFLLSLWRVSFLLFLLSFFCILLLSFFFSRVKRNAIHFCWGWWFPPFFPSCAPTTPPGQVLSFPDGSASRVSRLQSRPPWPITSAESFKRGGEKMGAAKRKAFGKNNNNCTKTNKIKTSLALDPADQIGMLHLPFWAPYLFFFRRVYIFIFNSPPATRIKTNTYILWCVFLHHLTRVNALKDGKGGGDCKKRL